MNLFFVDKNLIFVSKITQKLIKLAGHKLDHFCLLEPDLERALYIFKIEHVLHVVVGVFIVVVSVSIKQVFSHHSHSFLAELVVNEVGILIEFIIIHDEGAWSTTSHHFLHLLLLCQLEVNFSPGHGRKLILVAFVIDTNVVVLIELGSSLVVSLHALHEVITFNFILRIVDNIVENNIVIFKCLLIVSRSLSIVVCIIQVILFIIEEDVLIVLPSLLGWN